MLKPVEHDKQRGLLVGPYLLVDIIRSLQDDKDRGARIAGSFTTKRIRFLPTVGMTRKECEREQKS
jgi:hypothetical protein